MTASGVLYEVNGQMFRSLQEAHNAARAKQHRDHAWEWFRAVTDTLQDANDAWLRTLWTVMGSAMTAQSAPGGLRHLITALPSPEGPAEAAQRCGWAIVATQTPVADTDITAWERVGTRLDWLYHAAGVSPAEVADGSRPSVEQARAMAALRGIVTPEVGA